jgi:hypothetical protein
VQHCGQDDDGLEDGQPIAEAAEEYVPVGVGALLQKPFRSKRFRVVIEVVSGCRCTDWMTGTMNVSAGKRCSPKVSGRRVSLLTNTIGGRKRKVSCTTGVQKGHLLAAAARLRGCASPEIVEASLMLPPAG